MSFEEYRRFLSAMPVACVDCLVVNDRGKFLLVKRGNEPLMGEYWMPGGRIHKGEWLVEAVHRKMREEIGVDVDIVQNLGFSILRKEQRKCGRRRPLYQFRVPGEAE